MIEDGEFKQARVSFKKHLLGEQIFLINTAINRGVNEKVALTAFNLFIQAHMAIT